MYLIKIVCVSAYVCVFVCVCVSVCACVDRRADSEGLGEHLPRYVVSPPHLLDFTGEAHKAVLNLNKKAKTRLLNQDRVEKSPVVPHPSSLCVCICVCLFVCVCVCVCV